MIYIKAIALTTVLQLTCQTQAFTVHHQNHHQPSLLKASKNNDLERVNSATTNVDTETRSRRNFLEKLTVAGLGAVTATSTIISTMPEPANALVKGNAPPPKKKATEERKCVNVEECQEMAER
jgi:hypothetical protein